MLAKCLHGEVKVVINRSEGLFRGVGGDTLNQKKRESDRNTSYSNLTVGEKIEAQN